MGDTRDVRLPQARPRQTQFRQIEFINKGIDHLNGIVLVDPVFQALWKQRALSAIRPSMKRFIRSSAAQNHIGESLAARFHTTRVISDRSLVAGPDAKSVAAR